MRITVSTAAPASLIGACVVWRDERERQHSRRHPGRRPTRGAARKPPAVRAVGGDREDLRRRRLHRPDPAGQAEQRADVHAVGAEHARAPRRRRPTRRRPCSRFASPTRTSPHSAALTICSVGAPTPPGFWFLKTDHVANSTGADQTFIKPGDQLVFYRTPADFTADEELALDAPARTHAGLTDRGAGPLLCGRWHRLARRRSDGQRGRGAGPVDAAGNATVTFATEGVHTLVASKDYNDIPSQSLTVCVARDLDRLSARPRASDRGESTRPT